MFYIFLFFSPIFRFHVISGVQTREERGGLAIVYFGLKIYDDHKYLLSDLISEQYISAEIQR